MKVTVVSSLPPQKGITPYTVQLLDALNANAGVDAEALGFGTLYPRWMYPGGSPETTRAEATPSMRVRRPLSWYNPFSWIFAGLTLRGEILHAQWWSWFLGPPYVTVMAIARMRGKRTVVTVHNVRPHESAAWKRALDRVVLGLADEVIVHSERNKDALVALGFAPGRVAVVPMGAHAMPSTPTGGVTREAARLQLRIEEGAKVALFFGNIRPYKGVETLISAAALLRDRVPGLHVIVAGELWKGCRDPRAQIAALGLQNVVQARIGYVPDEDVAPLFVAADVIALPYHHFDGQSAAGALALSSGRAMIVSDAGALPDLVCDDRAVVPAGNPQALADAVGRVLQDGELRAKLEADTRAVAASLSWASVAEKTAAVYRAVISGPSACANPMSADRETA